MNDSLRTSLHEAVSTVRDGWPLGTPKARIVAEYLAGVSAGVLDVSGRPVPDFASDANRQQSAGGSPHTTESVLILDDDEDGALSAAVSAALPKAHVSAYNDRVTCDSGSAAAGARVLEHLTDARGLPGDLTAVICAPKATAALRETLEALTGRLRSAVVVVRDKHGSTAINEELARVFARVDVSPGLGKTRLIVGTQPHARDGTELPDNSPATTLRESDLAGPIAVSAYGACFGGTAVDAGSALLLDALAAARNDSAVTSSGSGTGSGRTMGDGSGAAIALPETGAAVLDLGCGNGWLLTTASRVLGAGRVAGTDVSKAACASAAATCASAGLEAMITVDDAGSSLPGSEWDVVLLNPPFHEGTTVTTDAAHRMIDAAWRLLRPGGVLVCVFNSHLRYRSHITAVFTLTQQWARDRRFTVIAAQKTSD